MASRTASGCGCTCKSLLSKLELFFSKLTFSDFKKYIKGGAEPPLPSSLSLPDPPPPEAMTTVKSLVLYLCRENKRVLIISGLLYFVNTCAQICLPLSLKLLVDQLLLAKDGRPPTAYLQLAPWSMFLTLLVSSLTLHHGLFMTTQLALRCSRTLLSALYNSMLYGDAAGASEVSVAQIAATDLEAVRIALLDVHVVWSCPLHLSVVTLLLLWLAGWQGTLGTVGVLCFLPLIRICVRKMIRLRRRRLGEADKRTKRTVEYLKNARPFKMNGWEVKIAHVIKTLRAAEEKLLVKELSIWGVLIFFTVVTPVVASAVVFITIMAQRARTMNASEVFTVLCLVQSMRFPVNNLGKLVGNLGGLFNALRRIVNLVKKDLSAAGAQKKLGISTPPHAMKCYGVTFRVGKGASGFELRDISLELKLGTMVGVVGIVGSGKTTLLR